MATCTACEGSNPRVRGDHGARCARCEREFGDYLADGWGLAERIARREAAIGTGKCAACGDRCGLDRGLCDLCRLPRHDRASMVANPYKKVWNSVQDEEAAVMASVRNGTLFVPTFEIMAERHRSTANYYRGRAANLGAVVGHAALKQAAIHDRVADDMDAHAIHAKKLRQATEFTFTVKEHQAASPAA